MNAFGQPYERVNCQYGSLLAGDTQSVAPG